MFRANVTDDRQTTDGRAIASRSRSLKIDHITLSIFGAICRPWTSLPVYKHLTALRSRGMKMIGDVRTDGRTDTATADDDDSIILR